MRSVALGLLVVCFGCNQVFGIKDTIERDAAIAPDGPPDAGVPEEGAPPATPDAMTVASTAADAADGDAGLQVMNYLPYDANDKPPSISLSANYSLNPAQSEEGKPVRVTGEPIGPFFGKSEGLKRCLQNLLDNALRYGDDAELVIEDSVEALTLIVRDRGPGVPEDQLERVFEPFYRLEPSRNPSTGGTGLGLSIARNIAQSMGGEITLTNHPAGGLEVRVVLPRSKASAQTTQAPVSISREAATRPPAVDGSLGLAFVFFPSSFCGGGDLNFFKCRTPNASGFYACYISYTFTFHFRSYELDNE
jgi:hypothetical protein